MLLYEFGFSRIFFFIYTGDACNAPLPRTKQHCDVLPLTLVSGSNIRMVSGFSRIFFQLIWEMHSMRLY